MNTPDNFTGGKIREFQEEWREISGSDWIYSIVKGVTIDENDVEPIPDKNEINFSPEMQAAMENEVSKLLDKKVIEKVEESNDQVVFNIFGR